MTAILDNQAADVRALVDAAKTGDFWEDVDHDDPGPESSAVLGEGNAALASAIGRLNDEQRAQRRAAKRGGRRA